MKSKTEYTVRRFKDGSLNFWCSYLHYTVLNGKLKLAAGGLETEESLKAIIAYLKRNKIEYDK